jgi:hypothetical protein
MMKSRAATSNSIASNRALFEIEWLLDTADVSRPVFDPDKYGLS